MAEYSIENPPTLLENGDIIKFDLDGESLTYHCRSNHLHNTAGMNSAIWTKLGLDKYAIASEVYGYLVETGSWPVCQREDYMSLTRIVLYLFGILSGHTGDQRGSIHLNVSMKRCLRTVLHYFATECPSATLEDIKPVMSDTLFLRETMLFLVSQGFVQLEGDRYKVVDINKVLYFNAKNFGHEVTYKSPISPSKIFQALEFLRASEKSVPLKKFYAKFGEDPQFIQDLVDEGLVKYWSGGIYVHPASAKAKRILAGELV